ncbi:MAG TPA: aromatic amino acid lyase [Streptosporangiaceae bacterium]|nr:aromatic amino acid lyase [Streptosporangiaceae bacterium]
MPAPYALDTASQLNADLIRRISVGQNVTIGAGLAREVSTSCAAARRVLERGDPVYGVNTGMGALSGVALRADEQRTHQRHLLLGRAQARALYAVRLRTFLSGDAGVSAELCQRLADFLAAGIVPAVPAEAAGTAGEIVQLAHAFGPLAGIGSVLAGEGRAGEGLAGEGRAGEGRAGGEIRPAAAALADHGLAAYELGPKEGIALLAGVPGATALSLLAADEAATVTAMMEAAAGLSIAVIGAPRDPYEAACARADDVLGEVLGRLRAWLPEPAPTARMLQAPVSFRVAGHALATLIRATRALAAAADRALAGVTDSPAFLDGHFVGTGGFHGIDLAAACDHVTAVLAHASEVSAARTHRLLDPKVTGLAAQLAPRPGPDAGLVTVHKRAAGEVHALRRLAVPSAVGTIETSNGQEDVQSFAWAAAQALRAALVRARAVAACELLTAWQATRLAGWGDAAGGGGGGAGVGGGAGAGGARELAARLGELIAPIDNDRPLGPDLERLADGAWLLP